VMVSAFDPDKIYAKKNVTFLVNKRRLNPDRHLTCVLKKIKHISASTVPKTSVLHRLNDCVGVRILYREDRALCLTWDKVDRLTYFGSPSAVGEPSKLPQVAKLKFWFRFDKLVFRISAGTTTALSYDSNKLTL